MGAIEKARKLGLMRGPRFSVADKPGKKRSCDDSDGDGGDEDNDGWELPPIQTSNKDRLEQIDASLKDMEDLLQDEANNVELRKEYGDRRRNLIAERELLLKSSASQKRKQPGAPSQEQQHNESKRKQQKQDDGERRDKASAKFWPGPSKPVVYQFK